MYSIQVFGANGTKQEAVPLDIALHKREQSPRTYACAIRVLLQNWRQGTVACKNRAAVNLSKRKPWKQKGTGRARAGTFTSPLWRKGGVIFGPSARVRKLSLSQDKKRLTCNNIFYAFYDQERIRCVDLGRDFSTPNTKAVSVVLKKMGLDTQKLVVFIRHDDIALSLSLRNLPNVRLMTFDQANAFDLSNGAHWIFFKNDVESFKDMVLRWN